MKTGIIGSGVVGKALSIAFAKEGYDVMLGTRNPNDEKIQNWLYDANSKLDAPYKISAGTFKETSRFGEIIVIAVLFRAINEVIDLAGKENFAGKIVIDTTNPIADEAPVNGVLKFTTTGRESAGEIIQNLIPDACVVKAFNSVGSQFMYKPQFEEGKPTMFICGNSDDAKKTVSSILDKFGWDILDCGSIEASNALEGLCIIWCSRGFREGKWNHAFKLLTY